MATVFRQANILLLLLSVGCVSPDPVFSDRQLARAMRESTEVIGYRVSAEIIPRTLALEAKWRKMWSESRDNDLPPFSATDFGKWTNEANQIHGYARLSEGIRVPKAIKRKLTDILLDSRSYTNLVKLCIFSPGVALQFKNEADVADVMISFQCSELVVFWRGTEARKSIDPAAARLRRLIDSFLPRFDDPFEHRPTAERGFE